MNYNPGLWLALCSIFGGTFGVFTGGWLSDQLVKKWGLHSRLWLLSVTTVIFALKNNIGLSYSYIGYLVEMVSKIIIYFWPKDDCEKRHKKIISLLAGRQFWSH